MRRATVSLVLINTLLVCGCVLPPAAQAPPAPPPPPSKYYVASVDTSSESQAAAEEGLKILDSRAHEALRPGIKVAFFPPDQCRNIAAATTTATPEAVEMANNCGVLISALENSVADRYSVVSWQTLKGDDPFARAEARKVDVIFEVDSFGMNALGTDASSQMRIDFYEQSNPTDRVPVALGSHELPVVAGRCKVGVDSMEGARAEAGMVGSFTGAIKAVEVSSGQALVYYQRTLTDDPGQASQTGFDLYFESKGQQDYTPPPPPPRKYNGLQVGGVMGLTFGAALMLPGIGLTVASLENSSVQVPGVAALASGAVLLLGGGILLAVGNKKARQAGAVMTGPGTVGPVVHQAPADVLCVQPTTPPWLAGPRWEGPAAPADQGGSSYSFSETQTAGRDGARERENRLRKLVIDDFTVQLGQLGG